MEHNRTAPVGGTRSTHIRDGTSPPHRILVVDDDDCFRHLNTEVLIHYGYYVDAVENGEAAWNRLQLYHYDLLVTDNNMPKVSGVELLRKLRDASRNMLVIMATGTSPEPEFIRQPWLKPAAIILKPFTSAELVRTVKTVLNAPKQP